MQPVKHFRELDSEAQMEYFNNKLFEGKGAGTVQFSRDFASLCMATLDREQRRRFVDTLTIQVSLMTYPKGCTEAQARDPEIIQAYYFNFANPPLDVLFECLWSAIENYRL